MYIIVHTSKDVMISIYILQYIVMVEYNEEFCFHDSWDGIVEDIKHVQERPDGSSDGLPEALDIDLGDGNRECSNWNSDLTQKWNLEGLFWEVTEPTADDLLEIFNKTKEELFPGKSKLTPKEESEVYNRMIKNGKI